MTQSSPDFTTTEEPLIKLNLILKLILFKKCKGLDLRKYSKEVERDLSSLEKSSIKDCNFSKFRNIKTIFY
jgi:hypothetical protein